MKLFVILLEWVVNLILVVMVWIETIRIRWEVRKEIKARSTKEKNEDR